MVPKLLCQNVKYIRSHCFLGDCRLSPVTRHYTLARRTDNTEAPK